MQIKVIEIIELLPIATQQISAILKPLPYLYTKKKMRFLYLILILIFASCNSSKTEQKKESEKEKNNGVTTLYFIRHAEKRADQGNDPELTEAGKIRSEAWVNYFFIQDVDVILSSNYKRTQATAEPLATSKKLPITSYDVKTLTGKELLKTYRGKTVVLFGHSNTINAYANELQTDTTYQELSELDYNHYFVVRVDANGKSSASLEPMDFMEN